MEPWFKLSGEHFRSTNRDLPPGPGLRLLPQLLVAAAAAVKAGEPFLVTVQRWGEGFRGARGVDQKAVRVSGRSCQT